jgi:hypothetical protein
MLWSESFTPSAAGILAIFHCLRSGRSRVRNHCHTGIYQLAPASIHSHAFSHVSPRIGSSDRLELRVRADFACGFGETSLPGSLLRALRKPWLQLCDAPNVAAMDRFD